MCMTNSLPPSRELCAMGRILQYQRSRHYRALHGRHSADRRHSNTLWVSPLDCIRNCLAILTFVRLRSFGSGVTISNSDITGHNMKALTWMYPPDMNVVPDSSALQSGLYSPDTTIEASYEVSVAAQGSVALTLTPSLAFKVQADISSVSKQVLQTNTHITAAFPNRMVIGVSKDESCTKGLQYWMDYEQRFSLITDAPALGWDMTTKNIYKITKRLLPPKCYKFASNSSDSARRGVSKDLTWAPPGLSMGLLRTRADDEPAVNPLFPDPTGSCLVCARDTYFDDSPCGALFDEDGNEIDPDCDGDGEIDESAQLKKRDIAQERGMVVKNSDKDAFSLCRKNTGLSPAINVAKLYFPSSSDVINGRTGGQYKTYAPDNKDDMLDYGKLLVLIIIEWHVC